MATWAVPVRRGARVRRRPLGLATAGLGFLLPVLFLVAWQLATDAGRQDTFWVSSPRLIAEEVRGWVADGSLFVNLRSTYAMATLSYLISLAAAVLLGLLLHLLRPLGEVLGWYLDLVYAIPKPALVPLLIFAFGLGNAPKVILAVSLVFFVLYYNVRAGLAQVDDRYTSGLLILGANRVQVLGLLHLRVVASFLVAGTRLGYPMAVLATVFAEFYSVGNGMGILVKTGASQFNATMLLSAIVVLAVTGACVDFLLRWAAARARAWQLELVN
jgi:NitT/TauT family transport system permease protein